MKIGRIIKELREDKELSQMQLSDLTGISQSAIARYELGKTEPKASDIIKLAKFFDISTEQILGLEQGFNLEISADEYSNTKISNLKIKKK